MTPVSTGSKRSDRIGGLLMIALGLAAGFKSVGYNLGSLRQMGAGFFPLALSVILTAAGIAIVLAAQPEPAPPAGEAPLVRPEWRGWICIALSIVAFVALGKFGGLVPASFAVVFIAALGDRRNTVLNAAVLAAASTAMAVLVFWWGLKLQLPLFGMS